MPRFRSRLIGTRHCNYRQDKLRTAKHWLLKLRGCLDRSTTPAGHEYTLPHRTHLHVATSSHFNIVCRFSGQKFVSAFFTCAMESVDTVFTQTFEPQIPQRSFPAWTHGPRTRGNTCVVVSCVQRPTNKKQATSDKRNQRRHTQWVYTGYGGSGTTTTSLKEVGLGLCNCTLYKVYFTQTTTVLLLYHVSWGQEAKCATTFVIACLDGQHNHARFQSF